MDMEALAEDPVGNDDKLINTIEKDESGFEDVTSISLEDSMSNSHSNSFPVVSTPLETCFNNSFTKRDDSGVSLSLSDRSSNNKDMSDRDVSEITNESIDGADSNLNGVDPVLENKQANETAENMLKVSLDATEENCENCQEKEVNLETAALSDSKASIPKPYPENNNDKKTEITDSEDEDFAAFVKKTLKTKAHVSRLVDYENTSSNGESDDEVSVKKSGELSKKGVSKRSYRKRKQEDCSDNERDDENESDKLDTGEPVLLRHSHLDENSSNNVVSLSELDSDSSDDNDDHETGKQESNNSEPDDTPIEVTEYGPPKHKWRALFDLRSREFGNFRSKRTGVFMRSVQGSLQMVQRLKLQYKMDHHTGCVNALNFNRLGTLLASGSDDLNVVVWNWIHNRPALVYDSGHRQNVFQTKFMPFSGDCHVVSCARDGQVRLADLSTTGVCKGTKKLAQHKGAAHKLALENDTPHIVLSAGEDAVTFQIDLRQEKPTKLVTTKENEKKVAMYSIHSNPVNSHEFCLGGRDHYIRVYDKRKINEAENDGVLKKYAPHHIVSSDNTRMKANVTCACYNYNGTEILGTYNDEDIYLFSNLDSDGANYVHRYKGHRNNQTVKGVNFYGAHSEFVVSGSDCGHIYLWDKDTENIVQFMEGDEGGVVNVLEPHPTAPVLATSGLDHDVKIWVPTAELPTTLKGLRQLTKQNQREREEERSSDADMIDGSMLWFIMHHLQRGRRRRAREARAARGDPPDDDDSSDTLSDDDLSSEEDSDSEEPPRDAISCNPS